MNDSAENSEWYGEYKIATTAIEIINNIVTSKTFALHANLCWILGRYFEPAFTLCCSLAAKLRPSPCCFLSDKLRPSLCYFLSAKLRPSLCCFLSSKLRPSRYDLLRNQGFFVRWSSLLIYLLVIAELTWHNTQMYRYVLRAQYLHPRTITQSNLVTYIQYQYFTSCTLPTTSLTLETLTQTH